MVLSDRTRLIIGDLVLMAYLTIVLVFVADLLLLIPVWTSVKVPIGAAIGMLLTQWLFKILSSRYGCGKALFYFTKTVHGWNKFAAIGIYAILSTIISFSITHAIPSTPDYFHSIAFFISAPICDIFLLFYVPRDIWLVRPSEHATTP